jgi:hypothetical protein
MVKVFLGLPIKNSILTKDLLQHPGWRGDAKCQFCGNDETITHMFFLSPVARYIWNLASYVFERVNLYRCIIC